MFKVIVWPWTCEVCCELTLLRLDVKGKYVLKLGIFRLRTSPYIRYIFTQDAGWDNIVDTVHVVLKLHLAELSVCLFVLSEREKEIEYHQAAKEHGDVMLAPCGPALLPTAECSSNKSCDCTSSCGGKSINSSISQAGWWETGWSQRQSLLLLLLLLFPDVTRVWIHTGSGSGVWRRARGEIMWMWVTGSPSEHPDADSEVVPNLFPKWPEWSESEAKKCVVTFSYYTHQAAK